MRELFKDEVRALGRELGLPEIFVGRHPFPGPGLAIRCPGDITREKLDILRKADAIYIDEIRKAGLYDAIWQAFAVLLPVKTVGVMGDGRTYEYVVGLRAVTSTDGMTADFYPFDMKFLGHVATRIINEVKGVNRVVYDVTSASRRGRSSGSRGTLAFCFTLSRRQSIARFADMTTNRRILVDNATLSGVGRLLGESQTLNLNNTDNDILCLEKLLTAILFSDFVIGVDDYKEGFRSQRLKKFDFIDFVGIEEENYNALARDAADFARSMLFSFDGSKPVGDVVTFFKSLRLDPQLRWDIFTSSEYLTLSFLVEDTNDIRYETAIDSMFRNEDADGNAASAGQGFSPLVSVERHPEIANLKALVKAFASGNASFSGSGSRSLLNRFVFGYGWTAERSYFYNAVAGIKQADAFLAPLRDAFCESCCRLRSRSQVDGLLEKLKSTAQEALVKIVEPSGRAKFAMKLPFFTASFISKTNGPKQCIDLALQTRSNKEFRECRVILHNLAHLSTQDKYQEVNHILQYLEQSCAALMKKYAVATGGGLQTSLSLGLAGPSVGIGMKLDQLFRHHRNRPFARVFRNIAQDMLNVERLGGLYEKLCSSVGSTRMRCIRKSP